MNYLLAVLSTLIVVPVYAADAVPSQPAPTPPAAVAPTPAPTPAAAAGSVARAQFTSAVQDHEPTDKLTALTNDKTHISFFTELKDLDGHKVMHRWEHDGKVIYEQSFDVTSARYRTYSSKTLDPSWTGEWKVAVVDDHGGTLSASTFTYEAAAPKAAVPAASATPAAAPAATPATPPAPSIPSAR